MIRQVPSEMFLDFSFNILLKSLFISLMESILIISLHLKGRLNTARRVDVRRRVRDDGVAGTFTID